MDTYFWFLLLISLNGLLFFVLSAYVSYLRMKLKVSYGDGGEKPLFRAIRAHGNLTEQLPTFALLILGLSVSSAPENMLAILVSLFTFSRLCHVAGLLMGNRAARQLGAGLSYTSVLVASGLLLINVFSYVIA